MTHEEILQRIGFHLAAIEQGRAAIMELARKALRTPEVQAMPGAQVRQLLMSWGLTEGEALALIVERIRERRAARAARQAGSRGI